MELTATGSREAGPRRGPLWALLAADAVSLVGNQITALAVPWLVLETTGSAARAGVVGAATIAPTVLAAFFGGALVDRLGYKRASVLSDLASAVPVAAIPLLATPVGMLLAGALTETLGVRALLLAVCGAVLAVAASLLGSPSLREMDRRPADG